MFRNASLCAVMYVLASAGGGVARAQSGDPRDAWMMKNYHFTGPPRAVTVVPTDPVVSELRQIQNTLRSIMRKADFSGDYETALAAAAQAAANAQVIGAITERLESTTAAKSAAVEETKPNTPAYIIALKDHSVQLASSYWSDGLMLHYLTQQGSHVQIRLDLVDLNLSVRLNREKNLEFKLQ
jgi:hypothetical protein